MDRGCAEAGARDRDREDVDLGGRDRGDERPVDVDEHELVAGVVEEEADEPAADVAGAEVDGKAVQALAQKNNCVSCHAIDTRVVGPSWSEIAKKHEGKADYIAAKIRSGGSGVWGAIPMPPQTLSDDEARRIASWLAAGGKP